MSSVITSITSLRPAFILLLLGTTIFSPFCSSSNSELIDTLVLEDFKAWLLESNVCTSSLVNRLFNGELFKDLTFSGIGTPLLLGITVVDDLLIGEFKWSIFGVFKDGVGSFKSEFTSCSGFDSFERDRRVMGNTS